jgi:hypothetical protein
MPGRLWTPREAVREEVRDAVSEEVRDEAVGMPMDPEGRLSEEKFMGGRASVEPGRPREEGRPPRPPIDGRLTAPKLVASCPEDEATPVRRGFRSAATSSALPDELPNPASPTDW